MSKQTKPVSGIIYDFFQKTSDAEYQAQQVLNAVSADEKLEKEMQLS